MSRLTRKENVDFTTNATIHTVGFVVSGDRNRDYNNALKKLYELENLEEQLGCPLEVMFKALENGIYTKESEADNKLELFEVRGIEKKGVSVISKFCGYAECDFTCEYKDYKKTWWLKEDKSE